MRIVLLLVCPRPRKKKKTDFSCDGPPWARQLLFSGNHRALLGHVHTRATRAVATHADCMDKPSTFLKPPSRGACPASHAPLQPTLRSAFSNPYQQRLWAQVIYLPIEERGGTHRRRSTIESATTDAEALLLVG